MADLKISQLNSLAGSSLANTDVLAVVDTSASETKKITSKELVQYGYGLVDPSTLDGNVIEPGTTSARGTVQLTDSTGSTSTTTAATPNAVKSAYDLANAAMPKAGGTFTGNISFEGSTDDAFETAFAITDPTADRTITFKDESGTVAYLSDISAFSGFLPVAGGTMTGQILGDDSTSASTPGYAFDGDPDTGLLRTGANELGLVTGGTNRLTIDATGNVVIPGNFTVQGTTTTIDTTTLVVEDKNIEMGAVAVPSDVTADGGGITLKGTTDKTINWIDATDAWTSSERFSVPLGTAGAPSLTFTGDPNTGIYSPSADEVAISTGGTGRVFIDSSGRLLSGTAAEPGIAARFTVAGNTVTPSGANSYGVARIETLNTSPSTDEILGRLEFSQTGLTGSGASVVARRTSGTWNQYYMPTYLTFNTSPFDASEPVERVRITSDGKVGIGTGSPGAKLHVEASSDTAAFNLSGYNFLKYNSTNVLHYGGFDAGWQQLVFHTNSNERLRISSSGVVTVKNGAVGEVTALTSASTVTINMADSNNFSLTLGHNVTLANPSNLTAGQSGAIVITQGSGTAYTVAYGSNWKFSGGTPTMSTGLSSVSTLVYYVESASRITAQLLTNVA